MSIDEITLQHVFEARDRIRDLAVRTPLAESASLSRQLDTWVGLKLETVQPIGAFKIRGAANAITRVVEQGDANGVVTASTGNHGRAVAYVARALGLPAVICLSENVPQNKVDAIRALGAELVIVGDSQDEAAVKATELVDERGLAMIHPFDDPDVIAGQGTIGLEIVEDESDVGAVLVPLSGGGLISGVAMVLKTISPKIRVVGVSMEPSPVMIESIKAGEPVELPELDTLADSLKGGIGLQNRYTFEMTRRYVDDFVLVTEEEIETAMRHLLHEEGLLAEGAGAVGVAALLSGKIEPYSHTVTIISGRNTPVEPWLLDSSP